MTAGQEMAGSTMTPLTLGVEACSILDLLVRSEVVRAERKQQDDRDRYPKEVEQDRAHLVLPSPRKGVHIVSQCATAGFVAIDSHLAPRSVETQRDPQDGGGVGHRAA